MGVSRGAEFMEEAIQLATENVRSGNGGPFGAVVVREDRVVARGVNLVTATNDPSAHAEVTAIRRACAALGQFELRGCTIYSSCEPCPMCLAAIYWARIDRVFYGNSAAEAARAGFDDGMIFRELQKPAEQRAIPSTPLLHDEAWSSFALWLETEERMHY